MKNILATKGLRGRLPAINPTALVLGASMIGSTLWGVWATDALLTLQKREVVTVQPSASELSAPAAMGPPAVGAPDGVEVQGIQ